MSITGPFSKVIGGGTSGRYKTQTWYRQKRPHLAPLPYAMYFASYGPYPANSVPGKVSLDQYNSCKQVALDLAYEKFKGKLSDAAAVAVNIAERKQSVDMMAKRLSQIARFARQLKKGDFPSAMSTLGWRKKKRGDSWVRVGKHQTYTRKGVDKTPKFKSGAKNFGNNFLEVHFGWEPLIKDVGSVVGTLQNGVPPVRVSATGRSGCSVSMGYPIALYDQGQKRDYYNSVRLLAYVAVDNPNVWLANQLGFVNPISVAWEMVPFSFVVDWFSNVGSFLSQWSDFLGLSITRSSTTYHITCDTKTISNQGSYGGMMEIHYSHNIQVERSVGIAKPALQLKPFRGLSVTRGLTAIALLLQTLK